MKKTAYIILILTIVIGCKSTQKDPAISYEIQNGDTLYKCNVSKINQVVNMKLSDWIDSFMVVRLENSDSALVAINNYTITDHFILISNGSKAPVKLFDQQGTFLREIGDFGNGPGEYIGATYQVTLNETLNRICIGTYTGWLSCYDLSGRFLWRTSGKYWLNKAIFRYEKDGSLTTSHLTWKEGSDFQYLTIDTGMNITTFPPTRTVNLRDNNNNTMGFNNELYLKNNTSLFTYQCTAYDTLYLFRPESGKTTPRFTATHHKKFVYYNEIPSYFLFNTFEEAEKFYLVDYKKLQSYEIHITNDFVGNIPIYHFPFNLKDGWFCQIYEPYILIEVIDKQLKTKSCTEKEQKKLKEIYDSINENDNSILFIGKLKSNIKIGK